jgi:hypothetical protein
MRKRGDFTSNPIYGNLFCLRAYDMPNLVFAMSEHSHAKLGIAIRFSRHLRKFSHTRSGLVLDRSVCDRHVQISNKIYEDKNEIDVIKYRRAVIRSIAIRRNRTVHDYIIILPVEYIQIVDLQILLLIPYKSADARE